MTEVTRALEDQRWTNLSTDPYQYERGAVAEDRRRELSRIRTFRRKNPLAKRAANLLQNYVVGQGLSWKAEDKKTVARLVDEFWDNPVNQVVLTSHQAQKWFLDRCFTDGEFFLVLFPDEDAGTLELGYLDAMFVDDVIPDPDNALMPLWYKVVRPKTKYDVGSHTWSSDGDSETVYYRDWRNTKPKPARMKVLNGLVYHVMPERLGKRGVSQLDAALDWLRVHQGFMGDRATINRAAAEIAWKKKRKGGPGDVAAEVDRLRSTLTKNLASWEQNPTNTSGATMVENEGSTLEWVTKNTGAGDASHDEKGLRMMVGAAVGVPNHYFGDEANANLATATAMELPLLKNYEDWQTLVRNVITTVIDFALQTANNAGRVPDRDDERRFSDRSTTQQAAAGLADQGGDNTVAPQEAFGDPDADPAPLQAGVKLVMVPKPGAAAPAQLGPGGSATKVSWYVDIDFPPIVQKEIAAFLTALTQFKAMLPNENIESQKVIAEMALNALGDNDVEQTMSRLYPENMVAVLVPNAPPRPPMMPPGASNRALAEARVVRLIELARASDAAGT